MNYAGDNSDVVIRLRQHLNPVCFSHEVLKTTDNLQKYWIKLEGIISIIMFIIVLT